MAKASKYISRQPDESGIIAWSEEENKIWSEMQGILTISLYNGCAREEKGWTNNTWKEYINCF